MIRRLTWFAVLVVVVSGGLLGLLSGGDAASQSPVAVPSDAESARADALRADFPGGDQAPAILVVTRADGGDLGMAEVDATADARHRMTDAPGPPLMVSDDGKAAVVTVPLKADLSGFGLNDAVKNLRATAADGLPPGLKAEITGGPAFGADIANSFAGANITLLAVTATVVALLLIVTYRSPVLWLVPLLVIAFADRVGSVVGTAVASGLGLSPDGSTSGITSVLVFGAGTNYALLLISRYREELGRPVDERPDDAEAGPTHREALVVAVRAAAPAIVASNATVVLALLTLLFASAPSNRSLGVQAASGLVVAAIFVLIVLPPLLALCGKRLFWPFIPKAGATPLTESGVWHRIADAVARKPARVAVASLAGLAVLASALLATPIGLTQTEQFRVQAESVTGYQTLAAHFPSGLTDPTRVIASTAKSGAVQRAITDTPGVVSATPAGQSPTGLSQWSVVIKAEPASDEAFKTIDALRDSVHTADRTALVGGSDAQARDIASAAQRDRLVVIPAILAVVLAVLYLLLRSALAPLVLVGVTVLSALAALGLGGWASVHVFGFPALDNSTPLFAFLFLVALGVDYTIFLVTRAREETPEFGTRQGIVRAVSATGAVITSAGVVLAAVFCVLGVLPLIVLTQLGIIVGLGILLDTFLVRTVTIPALFTLIGPRIWWPGLHAER
ncbi:MMPL family transporter [Mycolicibacterium fortuitum]|uniref:MMPL family transporter n=2 Tax=Mycolicibacterium fortuitum TaxID=1766 RepID=A0AAE4VCH4_MYCFO|nr:MMPL family transporter [Mycolicibacterium fortuitum]MCV7142128.1 MMPL family transporter [Mycolicibacterium fortuitum]MDV7192185.1 MMPL family transporter [Mycolicibacterium fortuitum]MDV7204916.1 MMPL family transporter [Mycolicibacterium fortuitum]MDV7226791.1 MMPL family transporter [Mycolicibacterium fortuitum]MDV7259173.1 MMPL family transporter [Mycolicibacterium fortuitum]